MYTLLLPVRRRLYSSGAPLTGKTRIAIVRWRAWWKVCASLVITVATAISVH